MSNWVPIYKTDRLFEAELLSETLREQGIACTILNQRDTAYGTFGSIIIRVSELQHAEALVILEKYLSNNS